jgi:hypothetical protein
MHLPSSGHGLGVMLCQLIQLKGSLQRADLVKKSGTVDKTIVMVIVIQTQNARQWCSTSKWAAGPAVVVVLVAIVIVAVAAN